MSISSILIQEVLLTNIYVLPRTSGVFIKLGLDN